jgi:hypothetical protein
MIGATMPCLRMIRVSFRSWARLWVRTERSGGRRSLTERSVISVAEPEEFIGQTRFRSVRPQDTSHEVSVRKPRVTKILAYLLGGVPRPKHGRGFATPCGKL